MWDRGFNSIWITSGTSHPSEENHPTYLTPILPPVLQSSCSSLLIHASSQLKSKAAASSTHGHSTPLFSLQTVKQLVPVRRSKSPRSVRTTPLWRASPLRMLLGPLVIHYLIHLLQQQLTAAIVRTLFQIEGTPSYLQRDEPTQWTTVHILPLLQWLAISLTI